MTQLVGLIQLVALTQAQRRAPLRAPPPSALEIAAAVVAIALALAAAIIGYRIIRGGKGL